MPNTPITFDDGERYERYMGVWSRLAGEAFLDWLAPPLASRWLDVGCGNGAFTELLMARCAPASTQGIDPSPQQLAYARSQPALAAAQFDQGDAMALPYGDDQFDVAVMPLVIFFVPTPARGAAEMARVVCPGGRVAAYAWDMEGGGFPYQPLLAALRGMDIAVPAPPSPEASRLDRLTSLWSDAGLDAVETHAITVERTYTDFDDYWRIAQGAPSVGAALAAMAPTARDALQARLRAALPAATDGRLTCRARANAVKGRVPLP